MKQKKFHWINDDVKIDFPVPRALQILMDECEKLDLMEDYSYFNYSDMIDIDAKELVFLGKLTRKQWDILNMRYNAE